ncbi:unnamed protein product [Nippostrongylus brasiliensis]|uniref:Protein enabled homolog n=1 Tax=Nippostrongylus brasiliensis TaxID=27835 RepID=A0A0N4XU66_NIPBR|nr:unnamed protein product [Nippostrongylus brasiliensis]
MYRCSLTSFANSDEPRLYRASGRFHKKVAAAAPIHTVTTTSKSTSSELSTPNPLGYDEGSHHVNKMTEDNSVMEEAAEFAKGLERTTVAVRNDDWPRTTTAPLTNSLNVPAIITPRVLMDEKRPPLMKPPQLAYPQVKFSLKQLPMGRPQPEIFTNTVSVQNNPTDGTLPFNPLVPPSSALQNIYQPVNQSFQPVLGAPNGPLVAVPPQPNPNLPPVFPGLPQLPPQLPQGIPPTVGGVPLQNPPPIPPASGQISPLQQLPTGVPPFPQAQIPPVPARHFAGASLPPQQPSLPGQVPPGQIPPLGVVTPPVPPPPAFPDRSEVINGQAANSSLEQLGCGFDWLTNSCKDVFNIGWCGQCHDFGNIFVHDCKCVHPLIALPPRQAPPPPRPAFFSMI